MPQKILNTELENKCIWVKREKIKIYFLICFDMTFDIMYYSLLNVTLT